MKVEVKKVQELRNSKVGWQAIADQLGDGSTAFGIRCREALYRLDVAEGRITTIKPTGAQVRKARDAGQGWPLIAIRAGISVGEARKLAAKDGKSVNPLHGRNYRKSDGTVRHSDLSAVTE
jgi:hypothetical protein